MTRGRQTQEKSEYVVERIEDVKEELENGKKKILYLVKWQDFPSSSNTWEPEENLKGCKHALQEFKNKAKIEQKAAKKKTKKPTKESKIELLEAEVEADLSGEAPGKQVSEDWDLEKILERRTTDDDVSPRLAFFP